MLCGLFIPQRKFRQRWYRDMADIRKPESSEKSKPTNPASSFPQQHKLVSWLGSGSEADVQAWKHTLSGTIVAVKILKSRDRTPIEVEILKELPVHPSIIQCLAYLPKLSSLNGDCIFFEHCAAGDLFELQKRIWRKKTYFSEACMWSIFQQLSSAVAFIHEGIGCPNSIDARVWRPVVHRDIKLENVFIATPGAKDDLSKIVVKLGDFGLSAFYNPEDSQMPGMWGTTILWPPEQTWEGRVATPAGDIWAVGCIVHELAHGFPPVVDPNLTERMLCGKNQPLVQWDSRVRKAYWSAKAQRKPVPINVNPKQQEFDVRRRRAATPIYSDALNSCMMVALHLNVTKRATAGQLKRKVDEEHAAVLFEDLGLCSEAQQSDMESKAKSGGLDKHPCT